MCQPRWHSRTSAVGTLCVGTLRVPMESQREAPGEAPSGSSLRPGSFGVCGTGDLDAKAGLTREGRLGRVPCATLRAEEMAGLDGAARRT